ncbi:MAG: DUF4102 domain-containing protein [Desulfovibrio sp.]|nr:DUF4102 domain-containing protein [Desulfovibrio sp.]MBR4423187.1 DUF4102 domain-containing protein [Mailhella sp.]
MPAAINLLTHSKIEPLCTTGHLYYVNDSGLRLLVTPYGTKRWQSHVFIRGREIRLGLGIWPDVSLKEARRYHAESHAKATAVRDHRMPASMAVAQLYVDWMEARKDRRGRTHAFQVRHLAISALPRPSDARSIPWTCSAPSCPSIVPVRRPDRSRSRASRSECATAKPSASARLTPVGISRTPCPPDSGRRTGRR